MDNELSYDKTSGYGEDTELELFCIRKFFGNDIDIEEVTSKELQYKGVDYIVTKHNDAEKTAIYIDCKIHHYTSDILVAEDYDDRPAYQNYGWLNPNQEHLTTYVIWIMPYFKKAYLYSHKMLMELRNTIAYKTRNTLVTYHTDGNTYNKLFMPTEIPGKSITWDIFEYDRKLPNIEVSKSLREYLI